MNGEGELNVMKEMRWITFRKQWNLILIIDEVNAHAIHWRKIKINWNGTKWRKWWMIGMNSSQRNGVGYSRGYSSSFQSFTFNLFFYFISSTIISFGNEAQRVEREEGNWMVDGMTTARIQTARSSSIQFHFTYAEMNWIGMRAVRQCGKRVKFSNEINSFYWVDEWWALPAASSVSFISSSFHDSSINSTRCRMFQKKLIVAFAAGVSCALSIINFLLHLLLRQVASSLFLNHFLLFRFTPGNDGNNWFRNKIKLNDEVKEDIAQAITHNQ